MEDTLWVARTMDGSTQSSLNPYSNGRYSMGMRLSRLYSLLWCLNPYSNGRYSMGK